MTHLPSSISAHHGEIQLPRRNHPECIQRWTDRPVRAGGELSSVIRTIPVRLQCSGLAFLSRDTGKGPRMGLVGQRNGLQILCYTRSGHSNAETPFDVLQSKQSVIRLYYVDKDIIVGNTAEFSKMNVPTVKGTMKLHQIISTEAGMVKYCDVREFRFCVQNQGCPTPGPPGLPAHPLIHLGAHLLSRLGLTAQLHVSLGLTAYLHPSLTVRPVRC